MDGIRRELISYEINRSSCSSYLRRARTDLCYATRIWRVEGLVGVSGRKMEAGETPQQALKREIREELDAEIEVGELLRTIDYDYPAFHLTMHCFKCTLDSAVTLLEHEAAKWLAPSELHSVRWLPADEDIIQDLSKCVNK